MVAARKSAGSSRGGIAKRRSGVKADRDGDLVMDSTPKARGGITKSRGAAGPSRGRPARGTRGGISSATFQRDVLRHVSSSDAASKAPRGPSNRGLEELRVTGWSSSKAASNDDGGVTSLITWLEKKATLKTGASKRAVRVKKSRVDGQDLVISVAGEDVGALLRMNGFVFAGANIKIERAGKEDGQTAGGSEGKESTVAMLKGVLARRYNAELKLLDLSSLGQDPDLKASAIFDSRSTTSKFFPALMKVLDQQFSSPAEKHEAIQSVTLTNNDLTNVSAVTTLSQTLSQLRNLDLSNNSLANLAALDAWRRKFSKLDHLVLTNNPIEQAEPDLAKTLTSWYPKLRLLNSLQVRSDEEAAKGLQVTDLPFPIRSPSFQDEGQIAEHFLRTFFAGFDTDRTALANHYYDDQSSFSFSVNTQAPRDPSTTSSTVPQEWDQYIKRSRNLKKIQQLPARQSRHFRGAAAIAECWSSMPTTRHPDLATDAKKWLIECQTQPGVPDPSGQSPVGVDGFLITVHGEFDELDASTGQSKKTRSFDRSFVIGPGGPTGVRVVNDMLTVRAYGGAQAFEPDTAEGWSTDAQQAARQQTPAAQTPAGLTPELAEQMVLELQKQTSMTIGYAKDCLEQVQWDFARAMEAFAAVRANLPSDAFVQHPAV